MSCPRFRARLAAISGPILNLLFALTDDAGRAKNQALATTFMR